MMIRMKQSDMKRAARAFSKKWEGKGDEKQEAQKFWIEFLYKVIGIKDAINYIAFEKPVDLRDEGTGFIDAYIPSTKVLIENKSLDVKLDKKEPFGRNRVLCDAFEQARRYNDDLITDEKAHWIITCNFGEFRIYNMNTTRPKPISILLSELESNLELFSILYEKDKKEIVQEKALSKRAGQLIGKLYDALQIGFDENDRESDVVKHSLNVLCVRLVFCLYAEDSELFEGKDLFYNYLKGQSPSDARDRLIKLFRILNTPDKDRDKYDGEVNRFPYVNGGLFSSQIQVPLFNDEILDVLLNQCSKGFDWSPISPTIFGAVFESTLDSKIRKSGGMHYTSIESIHKVIDPLFMNAFNEEFELIKEIRSTKTRNDRLVEFQKKLAEPVFLDPAAGSGNFLTESFLCLRRLENECIKLIQNGRGELGFGDDGLVNKIYVSIHQFYGIEINDFAVSVAKTALWIAEHQMFKQTQSILANNEQFLPLKEYQNIKKENALTFDWNELLDNKRCSFIIGNPPFLGYSEMDSVQKKELKRVLKKEFSKTGKLDYVTGWYARCAKYIKDTSIRCALVSTNSITQGDQVAPLWKPLIEKYDIHIDFAYRTFVWNSEALEKAQVHCVIIGFSSSPNPAQKEIFKSGGSKVLASNINPYLMNFENIMVESRKNPICEVPTMVTGNRPADGGHLLISAADYPKFLRLEPTAERYIKRFTGSDEYINNIDRYCLWLVNATPEELISMPEVMKRVEACRKDRLEKGASDRKKLATTPWLFRETNNPSSYMIVPRVSSEKRTYIPIGFLDDSVIPSDSAVIIPDADFYEFGILESSVHMIWTRTVAGRLKSDYRYSKDIVYNNFPWPEPSQEQKSKIEQTAQKILEVRSRHQESLATLYGERMYLFSDLLKAHEDNDKAVLEAYGFKNLTDDEIIKKLLIEYKRLTTGM